MENVPSVPEFPRDVSSQEPLSAMTLQFLSQIILLMLAISCMIWSGFITSAIIGEINRKLPEKDQISYLWGHYAKYRRIKLEYRRFYPNGRLWFYQGILT